MINAIAWIFEPRTLQILPWITYPFQDKIAKRLHHCVRAGEPMALVKARDMGASWHCVFEFFHNWLFRPMSTFLMGSRTQAYVDDTENPKSLFWKWDFLYNSLPWWLKPERNRTSMHDLNCENGAVCDGESTNPDFGRGDRRLAVLLDEFAAVEDGHAVLAATKTTTNCRIFNSTYQGTGNAFYDQSERIKDAYPDNFFLLPWWNHPVKAKGLYQSTPLGVLEKLDDKYTYPAEYNYILDGKKRSPWYDQECKESHPRVIAQEHDCDPIGSDYQYFDEQVIGFAIPKMGRPPLLRCEIEYSLNPVKFIRFFPHQNGRFLLWCFLDADGKPLATQCAGGADISAGKGQSNSCLAIGSRLTMEQLCEFADPRILPKQFGQLAVAACQGFDDAYLVWEAPGPGGDFGDEVIAQGYRHFFYRTNETSIGREQTTSPGWWPTPDNKQRALGALRKGIQDEQIQIRSVECLRECLRYVYTKNGKIAHTLAVNSVDPTGAEANHGDRVIAAALMLKGLGTPTMGAPVSPEVAPPENSIAWRRKERKREAIEASQW